MLIQIFFDYFCKKVTFFLWYIASQSRKVVPHILVYSDTDSFGFLYNILFYFYIRFSYTIYLFQRGSVFDWHVPIIYFTQLIQFILGKANPSSFIFSFTFAFILRFYSFFCSRSFFEPADFFELVDFSGWKSSSKVICLLDMADLLYYFLIIISYNMVCLHGYFILLMIK